MNPTTIRIWIHEKLLSSLEHVVFEGHGHLLLGQSTSNSKIKRFLDSVPKLMVSAREIWVFIHIAFSVLDASNVPPGLKSPPNIRKLAQKR